MNSIYCSECGTQVQNTAKFCFKCGHPMQTGAASPEAQSPIPKTDDEDIDLSRETIGRCPECTHYTSYPEIPVGQARAVTCSRCKSDYILDTAPRPQKRTTPASRSSPAPVPQPKRGVFSSVKAAADHFFGYDAFFLPNPTDSEPMNVTSDFTLYASNFDSKGRRIGYESVVGLDYENASVQHGATSSLVSTKNDMTITLADGTRVRVAASSFLIGQLGKGMRIDSAYSYLSKRTFQQRVNLLVKEIEADRYFSVGSVKIFPNGNVVKGGIALNLMTARENNALEIGTSGGLSKIRDPYEIVVGKTGTGMFSERIKFRVKHNQDVIISVISHLSHKPL